jgi:ribosomal-protein-alanine N-acetyltransferase
VQLDWREGLPLLVTPGVVLRELRRSDAAALWRIARSPDVARFSFSPPPSVEAFETFVARAWRDRADGKFACFAIVPRDQEEPAGMMELRSLQPKFFRAELGLLLEASLWGNRVFEDAMRQICEFAFKTVGVRRMEIRASVNHTPCNAALEKLGVTKEATLQSAFAHGGRYEDQYLWSLVYGLDRLAGGV